MVDATLFLRATAQMYVSCALQATRGLIKNWPVLLGAVLSYQAVIFASYLLGPLGLAGRFALGLLIVSALSLYYSWLSQTARQQKISIRSLLEFDQGLFFAILNVAFIFWLFELILRTGATGQGSRTMLLFVQLGLVFALNSLPEVIHQERLDGLAAITRAFAFTRDNSIEWFLPLILLLLPLLIIISPEMGVLSLVASDPFLPATAVITSWQALGELFGLKYPFLFLGLLCTHWYMIFRAFLFQELQSGGRRSRIFQAKQR